MSSRRTSASSSTSSRETSPEEYDDREEAEERLKALENLLALQFFAAPEEEEEAPTDDRPKKKRKREVEGTEVKDGETTQQAAVVEVEEKVGKYLQTLPSLNPPNVVKLQHFVCSVLRPVYRPSSFEKTKKTT